MGQQAFGIRFGKPELTSVVAVGCSLVAGDIVIAVDGIGNTTITIAEIGTDNTPTQDRAGYVGSATIGGLSSNAKYTYTATQGSTSYTGYFWTAPEADDDYLLLPITCDNNGSVMPGDGAPPGGYKYLREIAEANPDKAAYFLHVDDHYGYLDVSAIDDSGGTGHVCTGVRATTNALVYDYSLAAFASFGLYSDSVNAEGLYGQHEDYIWCMRNIPVLAQWGDHDCGNDEMGWAFSPTDNTLVKLDPSPKQRFDNCTAVWDAFLDPFRGTAIDAGNSEAWEHALGCVKIISPDAITNASGDGGYTTNNRTRPATLFGATQISNLIASCDDSSVPFKFMTSNYGVRYLIDEADLSFSDDGQQNPIAGNETFSASVIMPQAAHADYAALFTATDGILSKLTCNGVGGVFGLLHGDDHKALILRHRNTAGALDEWFWSINLGTITGSRNFGLPASVNNGDIVDGTEVIVQTDTSIAPTLGKLWYTAMFVYGSKALKEVEVYYYQGLRNMSLAPVLLYSGKFVESRGGNDMHDIGADLSLEATGSDGSTF